MQFTKSFNQLGKRDVAIAGGKGASLGEMTQAGIPVPEGFVILSNAFNKLIEETNLNVEIDSILHKVKHDDINTVENASEQIKAIILNVEMPKDIAKDIIRNFKKLGVKYVAVRSSATSEDSSTTAWAGQLESYLNTTKDVLLDNVKKCWASLFTPRAIFYRFEKELHKEKISVAVVVQKMVESKVSGIAFSVHPVTQDKNQIIIEAGYGLGEAIVSGQITPDSYVIEKEPRMITDKNVVEQDKGLYKLEKGGNGWKDIKNGETQKLSDKEILELSKLILRIENHYGFPCDVEWAIEKGKFYIVQSRPITTLSKLSSQDTEKENWLVVVSFRTELLTEAIIHKGYRESLSKLLPKIPKFKNRMIIDNDIYIDLTETGEIQKYFSTDTIKKATKAYDIIEEQSRKLIDVSRTVVKNKKNLSNKELAKRLDKFFKEYQKTIGAIGVPTIIDLTIESKLKEILKESGIENIGEALSTLAVSFKPVETSKEKDDLLKIGEKISKNKFSLDSKEAKLLIKEHYDEYGWLHSTLFLGKLYSESQIKEEIKKILNNVKEEKKKLEEDRKEHLSNAEGVINKIKSKEGKELAKFFQKSVYYRTARLEWMNKACFIVRPLLEDASNILKIKFDDIIYLLPEEIINLLNEGQLTKDILKVIEERRKGYAYISDNKNEYILAVNKELEKWKKRFSKEHDENLIKGIVVYKGEAKGRAAIVKDRSELNKVERGDILVTRLTTPDFIIAMKKAIGIVTDLGGVTSHAAVTSRELKIPCIVGTKNATKIIKDGDIIELDTIDGSVRILEKF